MTPHFLHLPPKRSTFSPDRAYRFTLWRTWGHIATPTDLLLGLERARDNVAHLGTRDQYLNAIGLNPSTADENIEDNTVRLWMQYAKDWGFGGLCVTNIFAFRATDPRVMKAHPYPIAPGNSDENDRAIREMAAGAGLVLCCWGAHGIHLDRGAHVKTLLPPGKTYCLGLTGQGFPRHPLYLPRNTRPVAF